MIFYIVVALLFNPLKKFWLEREVWQVADWIVAVVLVASAAVDLVAQQKKAS